MNIPPLPEVKILEPQVFKDERGCFFECYQEKRYQELLSNKERFLQDNTCISQKNVLRGLHFQTEKPQGKLVSVFQGLIYDVAVDIRPQSPSFGQWVGAYLSSENKKQFWIPKGFAHGFLTLSEEAIVHYKCSDYYHQASEKTLQWNDSNVKIQWPVEDSLIILSQKDKRGLPLTSLYKEKKETSMRETPQNNN